MRIERMRLHMEEAILQSRRSECKKKHVGAVAIRDGRIIASGYNGVLPGVNSKYGLGKDGNTKTVHAEANLIAYAAKYGIPLMGCTLYTTLEPCRKCAELLLQTGFDKIIFLENYRKHDGLRLLANSTLQILQMQLSVNQNKANLILVKRKEIPEDAE